MITKDSHCLAIRPDELRRIVAPDSLNFASTASLPAPATIVGQERALESIAFALALKDRTYNLYVSGESGTGRSTAVLRAVKRAARAGSTAQDWCYVYHFELPGEPLALALPAGTAPDFAYSIDAFVTTCRHELRRAFTSDVYRQQTDATLRELKTQREELLGNLHQEALARGVLLQFTPTGIATIPLKRTAPQPSAQAGVESPSATPVETANAAVEPMSQLEFEALPAEDQQRLNAANEELQEAIDRTLPQLQALDEEARRRMHDVNHTIARQVVAPLAETVISPYRQMDRVVDYIRHIEADIVAHAEALALTAHEGAGAGGEDNASVEDRNQATTSEGSIPNDLAEAGGLEQVFPEMTALLRRYRVNVMVTQHKPGVSPVVQEINPTYANLVGRTEFGLRDGLPVTDHLMLQSGAFHRANGGYIILHARDLFTRPNAWQAVKRTLRFGVISIEDSDGVVALPASASIRPEPIPVNVKVILIGDPETYSILQALDPEFGELFKVRADFDSSMLHTAEAEQFYAQFVGDAVRCASLPPLSVDAVALCIEEGSRWVADQGRLSTVLSDLRDLAVEAASVAAADNTSPTVAPPVDTTTEALGADSRVRLTTRAHVLYALTARERRMNLAADRIDDMIREGTILIDNTGEAVGQINGLTVLLSGNYAFGKPARITARVAPGLAGIVNIERETMMSGPSHSKGILVLGGYLAGRFAHDQPLSLSATICLEQVYGEIEGDSASSAELYALLSSLSGLPIKQSLAVTGSVNQHGVVQAIGGVNEKIEGFFTLCARSGLTGEQGVIIPRANVRNLMLRSEVIDAVRAGKFAIYAVSTIDEGIEILTGVSAGSEDVDGMFSEGSVNGRVSKTLHEFARSMREFAPSPSPMIRRTARVE